MPDAGPEEIMAALRQTADELTRSQTRRDQVGPRCWLLRVAPEIPRGCGLQKLEQRTSLSSSTSSRRQSHQRKPRHRSHYPSCHPWLRP